MASACLAQSPAATVPPSESVAASETVAPAAPLVAVETPPRLADWDALASIDPLSQVRGVAIRNRTLGMADGTTRNTVSGELYHPFAEDWLLHLVAPFVITDQMGDTTSTGDLRIGLETQSGRDDAGGLVLGADLIVDTCSEPAGGRGWTSIEPRIVWVFYRGERTVVAPSYRHTLGISGHEWRSEINEGALSLLLGWLWADGKGWTAIVPEALFDFEGSSQFVSGAFEFGFITGPNSTLHVRPCFGFTTADAGAVGADYPYDWGIELGWRLRFE